MQMERDASVIQLHQEETLSQNRLETPCPALQGSHVILST